MSVLHSVNDHGRDVELRQRVPMLTQLEAEEELGGGGGRNLRHRDHGREGAEVPYWRHRRATAADDDDDAAADDVDDDDEALLLDEVDLLDLKSIDIPDGSSDTLGETWLYVPAFLGVAPSQGCDLLPALSWARCRSLDRPSPAMVQSTLAIRNSLHYHLHRGWRADSAACVPSVCGANDDDDDDDDVCGHHYKLHDLTDVEVMARMQEDSLRQEASRCSSSSASVTSRRGGGASLDGDDEEEEEEGDDDDGWCLTRILPARSLASVQVRAGRSNHCGNTASSQWRNLSGHPGPTASPLHSGKRLHAAAGGGNRGEGSSPRQQPAGRLRSSPSPLPGRSSLAPPLAPPTAPRPAPRGGGGRPAPSRGGAGGQRAAPGRGGVAGASRLPRGRR